jgi:hypothetical protein
MITMWDDSRHRVLRVVVPWGQGTGDAIRHDRDRRPCDDPTQRLRANTQDVIGSRRTWSADRVQQVGPTHTG